MRMTSLASGSSGNCTLIQSDNDTHILVDAGISCKRIQDSLHLLGVDASDLSGIFITHEHSDHISGLKVLCKKRNIPIYGTLETLSAIQTADRDGVIDPSLYHPILPDSYNAVGELTIIPFSNTHDAANPVGYRIESGRQSVAVCTDLGNYSAYTISHLRGLNAILLEANHDIRMLQSGPYPYSLKRRILSEYGHLSNEASGHLLSEILHDGMQHVLLGHLSKDNNYEDLALEAVRVEVDLGDTPYHASDFPIDVAKRDRISETIHII